MTPVVTLNRERPLHPWLRTPDELDDHLRPTTPRETYGRALLAGFGAEHAGTLAAWRAGIHLVGEDDAPVTGWRLREVQHLEFLRSIVRTGRLAGDAKAAP